MEKSVYEIVSIMLDDMQIPHISDSIIFETAVDIDVNLFIIHLQKYFKIEIESEDYKKWKTIKEIEEYIKERIVT